MKIKVTRKKTEEIEIALIEIHVPADEVEEHDPALSPALLATFLKGKFWTITVDVDTGRIEHWPLGQALDLYCKPTDGGRYLLLDPDRKEIALLESYVPNACVPGEWGDYVDLKINADGVITNWPKPPDFDAFFDD